VRRLKIHWHWVPAAIFASVVGWLRYGPAVTGAAVAAGLVFGLCLEWRAQRRRADAGAPRDE
jgi:hypothetical protein